MNRYKIEYSKYSSEYLIKRRALGDEIPEEAHQAMEEIFRERGESLPPKPSRPVLESDLSPGPSKLWSYIRTGALIFAILVSWGAAKVLAHTSIGIVCTIVGLIYLMVINLAIK